MNNYLDIMPNVIISKYDEKAVVTKLVKSVTLGNEEIHQSTVDEFESELREVDEQIKLKESLIAITLSKALSEHKEKLKSIINQITKDFKLIIFEPVNEKSVLIGLKLGYNFKFMLLNEGNIEAYTSLQPYNNTFSEVKMMSPYSIGVYKANESEYFVMLFDVDQPIKNIKMESYKKETNLVEDKLDIFEGMLLNIVSKWKDYRDFNKGVANVDIECVKGVLEDLTDKSPQATISEILKELAKDGKEYRLELIENNTQRQGPPMVDRLRRRNELNLKQGKDY